MNTKNINKGNRMHLLQFDHKKLFVPLFPRKGREIDLSLLLSC